MKIRGNILSFVIGLAAAALPALPALAGNPTLAFLWPAQGRSVSNLAGVNGLAASTNSVIQTVTLKIREVDIHGGLGRWWNGTNFQNTLFDLPADLAATNWTPSASLLLPAMNPGQSYELTATAIDDAAASISSSITVNVPVTGLAWDPGATAEGAAPLANPNTNGGNYHFAITTQNPAVGVWRTALKVISGEANLYLGLGSPPTTNSASYESERAGSDGVVLHSSQFSANQSWYLLVNASPGAVWTLLTGDAFVHVLGPLAADASSGTNVAIGPEGMLFFRTTIAASAPAWRLWVSGATNTIYVKKDHAPHPVSSDLAQERAMLVVEPYLSSGTFNGSFFIGVPGVPGTAIALDSRQQAVTDLPFNSAPPSAIVVSPGDFPYLTYRVQVPPDEIAWEISLNPSLGNPNLALRRDLVPNEFRNDAFSDVGGLVNDSVALVPASSGQPGGLTDGTFYLTAYGAGTYTTTLTNGAPVITQIPFDFQVVNDATNRAGWRYFQVTNFASYLGNLGWELLLSNAPPNTEIAIRRTYVAGRWRYRYTDNYYAEQSAGFVDDSDNRGFLQRPGHQADVWFVGVYQPSNALGQFQLTGRVITAEPLTLDGGVTNVTGQLSDRWEFYRVEILTNTVALGWDVRVEEAGGGGTPELVVRRDGLPGSFATAFPNPWDRPWLATNWPSGYQWAAGYDWTGYYYNADGTAAKERVLTMGLGNPLRPGTYYVGVRNNATGTNTTSYTLRSRAIGTNGESIVVRDLGFAASTNGGGLAPREAAYYRVVVPNDVASWKIKLTPTAGESLLVAHRGWIPNSGAAAVGLYNFEYVGEQYQPTLPTGGRRQQKSGNEHLAALPYSSYGIETNLPPGEYYLAVVSEGVNPDPAQYRIGSGPVSYTLSSLGPVSTNYPGTNGAAAQMQAVGPVDLVFTHGQEFGEYRLYQFSVPAGVLSMEVRLENRVGNPWMSLQQTSGPVAGDWYGNSCNSYYYGSVNGESAAWSDGDLLTVASPVPGTYTLAVATHPTPLVNVPPYDGCQPANVSYTVRVRSMEVLNLSFSSASNSSGLTNVLSGVLADDQRAYFRVIVPATVSNAPVLGWKLDLAETSGASSVRVRPGVLPSDQNNAATTPFATGSALIAPPYLTPGTWYVEVKGSDNTAFTLTSSVITTNTLARPLWAMPALGASTNTSGLSLPLFGDTGVAGNGTPLLGDQGTDLEQGLFHYYAIVVPTNNGGLLRTELQAISGNPNLYLRAGAVPTATHGVTGGYGTLYDRALTGNANSEYGNWVPLNGFTERELAGGVWVIAVQAAGGSNCRYRLRLSCGNPVAGGLVQELPPDGTTLTNSIAGRDWQHYRFTVPENPPANYVLAFNRTLGGARVYVRDTTPPGDSADPQNYDSGSYTPVNWSYDSGDYPYVKNQGPYPRFADPGTYFLSPPPLRPGSTYYLGVWSLTDSTFSLSLSTNGAPLDATNRIAFYGGDVTNISLPANATHLYRVDVPAGASRWKHYTTNSAEVVTTLEQGTLPRVSGAAHWRSSTADASLNQPLTASAWPWQPGRSYYLLLTNTSASPQTYTLRLDGRNAATEDEDDDSLPDAWEMAYFGNTWQYNANSDPDGDGVSNGHEFLNGSNPQLADAFGLMQPERLTNGVFQFLFVGPNNGHYRAQYRTNLDLESWTTLLNFTNAGGATLIMDTNAPTSRQRFYRAVPY